MSILKFLGLEKAPDESSEGDTETVRKIVAQLESMSPERARFVAAFAYTLSRVANADLEIDEAETRAMEHIVAQVGELPEDQAVLAVQIAKSQARLFGGTENFLVTREFKEISSAEERRRLLDCLFAVSAADGAISSEEELQVKRIASELGFSHQKMVEIRSTWNHKRAILKNLPGGN
ncbi:MAG: TerB family tellurite resistance protein [Acidobacteriota bacterium]